MNDETSGRRASLVVRRRVLPGAEAAYERLLGALVEDAKRAPGHLGSQVVRPHAGHPEYHIAFHFEAPERLEAWTRSEGHRRWFEPMTRVASETEVRVLTGLETWFTVPEDRHARPPARYKMALVTWLAIYPTVLACSLLIREVESGLPLALSTLAATAVTVPVVTYLLLPRLTRLFEGWLFARREGS